MYPVTQSAGGFILILSSIISLGTLLRKQFRQYMNTSFYMLSVSDILCSIITACIVLRNHIENMTTLDKNLPDNSAVLLNNIVAVEENKTGNRDFCESSNTSTEFNLETSTLCDTNNVIMQYAVLFVPLTNTFVSLLIFSIQCNISVACFKNNCTEFLKTQTGNKKDQEKSKDYTETVEIINSVAKSKSIGLKFLRNFNFGTSKVNNKKILSIFLVSQWTIPIIVTGILYSADYDYVDHIENMDNMQCTFHSNFPFENCYKNDSCKIGNITQNGNLGIHAIMVQQNNYIAVEDLPHVQNTEDSQVNEIIKKVQNVVKSVLNDTVLDFNNTRPTVSYNISEILNATKYLKMPSTPKPNNSVILDIPNSTGNISMEDTTSDTSLADLQNDNDILYPHSNISDNATETIMFNNFIKDVPGEVISMQDSWDDEHIADSLKDQNHNYDEANISVYTVESINQRLMESTTEHDTHTLSKDKIFADIIKRIHGANAYNILKNQHKDNLIHSKKEQKQMNFTHKSIRNTSNLIDMLSMKSDAEKYNVARQELPSCMANKCFLSVNFLKLHLLVLTFMIYFLPILISSILIIQGKLTCKIISSKVEARMKTVSDNIHEDSNAAANINSVSKVMCGSSKWFPEWNFFEDSSDDSTSLQQEHTHRYHYSVDNKMSRGNIIDNKERCLNLMKEIEGLHKLVDTLKISLLWALLLWTPIFLQTLYKVFLCLHVPEWVINITFFAAIAFVNLRNIFNMKMIKLQGSEYVTQKGNSIHPIE